MVRWWLKLSAAACAFSGKVDDTVVTFSGKVDRMEVVVLGFLFERIG